MCQTLNDTIECLADANLTYALDDVYLFQTVFDDEYSTVFNYNMLRKMIELICNDLTPGLCNQF